MSGTFSHSERKYIEILRILRESRQPVGAKRLSELMAEQGFVMSARAIQYYLRHLDSKGFTRKVGNMGRVLTEQGLSETDNALVDERIGFIISKLEKLAFRSTFNPETGTGDVAYNLSIVREEDIDGVIEASAEVVRAGCGFFSTSTVTDDDPRVPEGHTGLITLCSVTLDGVLQHMGIPVDLEFGGRLAISRDGTSAFTDLIRYQGTTIDPLALFISAGLTSVSSVIAGGEGVVLANVREVPYPAKDRVEDAIAQMKDCGFAFPEGVKSHSCTIPEHPYRLPVTAYSGMNHIANATEKGYEIKTEIGAGTIRFSKIVDSI